MTDTPMPPALHGLTEDEHRAMELAAQLVNQVVRIMGFSDSRHGDIQELVWHIHGIQNMILAQAAARAYPDRYRLLGKVIPGD
jgi:hypothetical protein